MTTQPEISQLLNAARDHAVAMFDGRPATPPMLHACADAARRAVLAQAELGAWAPWGVTSAAEFGGLRCELRIVAGLTGLTGLTGPATAIQVVWDFKRTPLHLLVTESVGVSS